MVDRHPPGWTPRGWTPQRTPPASGWTPVSAGYPPRAPVRCLNSRGFQASQLDAGLRWLPKKPALSLANYRAKPASIRFSPERNRKTTAWRFFSGPRAGRLPRKNRLQTGFGERFRPACGGHLPFANPCPRTRPEPHRLAAGFLSGPRKPGARPSRAHASCEDIPFVGRGPGSVNPFRCLSENSLTGRFFLTAGRRSRPRSAATAWRAARGRSAAR
jgi:hypothetical protein